MRFWSLLKIGNLNVGGNKMGYFVGGLVSIALVLIGYVLFANYRQKIKDIQEAEDLKRLKENRVEEARIKQKRQEKRRKEKMKLEQEKIRTTLRKELAPHLQGFVAQNLAYSDVNLKLSQYILKTGVINIKELMDYQIQRKLNDGTTYRVGLVKQVGEYELSLDPNQVENLQKYFVDFFELYEFLRSKGLKIDPLGLVELISQETQKFHKIS